MRLHVILLWITQQQHDGFTAPRNIWACALLQTSKKEQWLARSSPCTVLVDFWMGTGTDIFPKSLRREHVENENATRQITPIISIISIPGAWVRMVVGGRNGGWGEGQGAGIRIFGISPSKERGARRPSDSMLPKLWGEMAT